MTRIPPTRCAHCPATAATPELLDSHYCIGPGQPGSGQLGSSQLGQGQIGSSQPGSSQSSKGDEAALDMLVPEVKLRLAKERPFRQVDVMVLPVAKHAGQWIMIVVSSSYYV